MAPKVITPALGENSFSCAHCGARSHQTWYRLFLASYQKDAKPFVPTPDVISNIRQDRTIGDRASLIEFFERLLSRRLFVDGSPKSVYTDGELMNLYVSLCYSCSEYSVWLADRLIAPAQPSAFEPNEEMPADVKLDFQEASSIVDQSPRGAAALLRLSIQRLMPHLGLKGKNIDNDIGELMKRGLDARIQQALDVVRVVGNNAVHPGQIDLRDDKATAAKLFGLVNLIVEAMIATPKHIASMYEALPEGALKAIERRDQKDGT